MPDDVTATASFVLDRSRCYVNAASRTPLPTVTLEAGKAAMQKKAVTPWNIGDTEAQKDECRALFATMLPGATADDIAMVPCCSYAMTLAANNFRARMRARPPSQRHVLVLHDQNPSNVMQWQQLCEDEGGALKVVHRPADGDWARVVCAALVDGSIAVAALPPCHWTDGALVDLGPISAACKASGTALVVDATQWLGAGTIDVRTLGISFLACSIHKWLLGPYGGCLCYAAPDFWRSAQPLEFHDRNREGAQEVECLPMGPTGFPMGFMHGARRLDGGGRPSFIVLPMLLASLELLVKQIRVERLQTWLGEYTAEIGVRARRLGFSVPARHAPGIIGLRPTASMPDASTIVSRLKARQSRPVLVSDRFGAIRVAPHIYNDREDLECLMCALAEAIGRAPDPTATSGHRNSCRL
jgi:selenocysteine lyase/cysteine desulfurase